MTDYLHRPHSSIRFDRPMATYRRPMPGWFRFLHDLAGVVTVLLIIAAAMAVCYVVAPPVDERPSVSYLPEKTGER